MCRFVEGKLVGIWPFASLRCGAEFGRNRGIADIIKPRRSNSVYKSRSNNRDALAAWRNKRCNSPATFNQSMLEFQNISKYGGTSVHAVCCLDGDGIFARSGTVTIATKAA